MFIQETPINPDDVPIQEHLTMSDINITNPSIEKILKHKAAGPGQIAPQVLMERADVLGPILTTSTGGRMRLESAFTMEIKQCSTNFQKGGEVQAIKLSPCITNIHVL